MKAVLRYKILLAVMLFVVWSGVAFAAELAENPLPDFQEGFEEGPGAWAVSASGKQPLSVSRERAHSGSQSAYSGLPKRGSKSGRVWSESKAMCWWLDGVTME